MGNRAARRAQAKCRHAWNVKTFPSLHKQYRHCGLCGSEQWRDTTAADILATEGR